MRGLDVFGLIQLSVQAQVFKEIVFAHVIATKVGFDDFAVTDDDVARAFDQNAEPVPASAEKGDQPVQCDEDEPAAESRPKGGGPIDSAGEHGGENEAEDGVERGLFRKEPFVSQADHNEGDDKHDDAPQRDVREGQFFGLAFKSEESLQVHLQPAGDSGRNRGALSCAVEQSGGQNV